MTLLTNALTAVPKGLSPSDVGTPPRGGAQGTNRPGVALRLLVRLEDFTNDDGDQAQAEGTPAKSTSDKIIQAASDLAHLKAVRDASGEFDAQLDKEVVLSKARAARVRTGKTASTDAAAPANVPADASTIEIGAVPLDYTLDLNGFRTADKLDFEVDLANLPIPPDLVRSLFVEAFMDEVDVNDFGDPRRWIPRLYQSPPMFRGYADEESMTLDDSKLSISVSAQSLEQRLMTLKINPFTRARQIAKGGEPITHYIQKLISTIPEFNGTYGAAMGVRMFPNVKDSDIPHLDSKLFKRSLQSAASRAAAGGNVQGAPPAPVEGEPADPAQDPSNGVPAGVGFPAMAPQVVDVSVWDIITRAAELAGVIPIYDPSIVATDTNGRPLLGANNILLVPPQNLMETPQNGTTIPGGPVDGFSREVTIGGTSKIFTNVRLFVWGSNIKNAKWGRKYGRQAAPRVRVVCHNPDAKAGSRVLTAVFPKTLRGTTVSAKGTTSAGSGVQKGHPPIQEEVVRIIREVRDQAALERYAVALYHSIGRQEVTCTIETNDLTSYSDPSSGKTEPDVLRLRPGACCRVMVGIQDPASPEMVVNGLSDLMSRRFNPAFLRKALMANPANPAVFGGDQQQQTAKIEAVLSKLENTFASTRLTDWFYVKNVQHRWSPDDGWSATIELATFQEARNLPSNLAPEDKAQNDALKAVKPGTKPDARQAAINANLDALLDKATSTSTPGGQ